MLDFWKSYVKQMAFALALFVAAAIIYLRTDLDPRLNDKDVTAIVRKLDDIYSHQIDPGDKRQAVMEELLREREQDFSRLIWEHLAEALILAGVMILTVEGLARYNATKELKERAEQVSKNIWDAISKRLVPGDIAVEIQRILKSDVCRVRPRYTITFTAGPYKGLSEGQIVVRRELSYQLLNITGGQTKYPINLSVLSHTGNHLVEEDGIQVTLPRICAVTIHHERMTLKPEQRLSFSKTVHLPKMGIEDAWEVYSNVEEVFNLTDRALYVLSAPCYGLELQVVNHIPHLIRIQKENVYLTIGRERLKITSTPDVWVSEGGLLAGVALSLSWEAVSRNQQLFLKGQA